MLQEKEIVWQKRHHVNQFSNAFIHSIRSAVQYKFSQPVKIRIQKFGNLKHHFISNMVFIFQLDVSFKFHCLGINFSQASRAL